MKIPEPAQYDADTLVAEIRRRGGRVYRMRDIVVFALTNDPEVASWIFKLGGTSFLPHYGSVAHVEPHGSYRRASGGPLEWDIYVHTIPVTGEKTIYEAAGPLTFVSHDDAHAHERTEKASASAA